jgi:threonine/homoserine/homoserine lactone efflux protein
MTLIFFSSLIASLAYCAAPGAINAEGIRRGLHHGFRSSLIFQVGALAGDMLWAIVALSGLAMLRPPVEVQLLLGTSGGLFMVWMAWGILSKACHNRTSSTMPNCEADLLCGVVIAFANPFALLFWLSIGGGLLAVDVSVSPLLAAGTIIGTFTLATLLWSLLMATLATYGRRMIQPAAIYWIDTAAGIMMALFGIGMCWQTMAILVSSLA